MRGRTGGMAAALSALALVAAGCGGGGGSEPEPATSQAWRTGGEITVRSCTPQNPLIPANTNEACGGNMLDAIDGEAGALQRRHGGSRAGHRRVDRDQGQPELHRQAEAGLQVPRRHRGQGQELRRCLELERVRPQRQPERLLLRADRGLRRLAVRHRFRRGKPTARASRRRPRR